MPSRRNRRNYYRILHVQPDAPPEVLKSCYRTLMRSLEMHPDRGGDHWNAALVNEAYRVLSDPAKRAEYDTTLDITRFRNGPAPERRAHPSAAGPSTPGNGDGPGCLFCGSRRADRSGSSPVCSECRSPLTPAGAPQPEVAGQRSARRVERDGVIRYYEAWPQRRPGEARIVDLSPRGLQLESPMAIEPYRIVKLEGPVLDAVARVVACREKGPSFAVGVQFYTVHLHLDRGTFLSANA